MERYSQFRTKRTTLLDFVALKWTDVTQNPRSWYGSPFRRAALLGDVVPSGAVPRVSVAAEGSAAICSGHVWFKSVSGGATSVSAAEQSVSL